MSPDWSAKVEPVPYAKLGDPQSLNLYGYMLDSPLDGVDQDGHWGWNQRITNWFEGHGFKTNWQLHTRVTTKIFPYRPPNPDPWNGHWMAQEVFGGPEAGSFGAGYKTVEWASAYDAVALAPVAAEAAGAGASTVGSWAANSTGLLGPATGRVFWSAIGSGAAAQWAEENGGSTLEMSPLGSFANWAQGYLPQTRTTGAAWSWLSQAFASGAEGPVTYLQGPRIGNTWACVERPILESQGNPINFVPMW